MIAGAAIASNIDTPTLQAVLEGIRGEVAAHTDRGIVPGYIAPLAQVDPAKFGIVVALNDGRVLSAGQVDETFSVQSITKVWGIHLTGVRNLPPRAARRRSLQAGRMSALSRRLGRNSLWALAYDKVVCISREPSLKRPKRLRVVGAGMGTFHCPNLRPTPVKWIPRSCLMGKFTNGE